MTEILISFFFFFFCLFAISWTALAAYGGSQARGLIGATAADLHHSYSNAGSKPSLQPIPQLTAMKGSNLHPHGCWSDLFLLSHDRNSLAKLFNTC